MVCIWLLPHSLIKIHLCYWLCQFFVLFLSFPFCWIVIHCITQFVSPFTCWWIPTFFSVLMVKNNKAVMHICINSFVWTYFFFLVWILWYVHFTKIYKVLPKWLYQYAFPYQKHESSPFSIILSVPGTVRFFLLILDILVDEQKILRDFNYMRNDVHIFLCFLDICKCSLVKFEIKYVLIFIIGFVSS